MPDSALFLLRNEDEGIWLQRQFLDALDGPELHGSTLTTGTAFWRDMVGLFTINVVQILLLECVSGFHISGWLRVRVRVRIRTRFPFFL